MDTAADRDDKGAETAGPAGGLLITGSFAGERTTVEALRLEDGLPVWWYDSRLWFDDLVCHDGMVFVSSMGRPRPGTLGPAAVVALRAADGTQVWHMGPAQIHRQMALKRVRRGLQVLWQTSSPRSALYAAKSLELAGYTYLAAADGLAVVCKSSVIFALDARTGMVRWTYATLFGLDRRLITARDDLVYVRSEGGMQALDARTGKARWSGEFTLHVDEIMVSDAHVYIIDRSARKRAITVLRVADGRREYVFSLAEGEFAAQVTNDGIAYLMRHGRLRAVRVADGTELWRSEPLRNVPEKERESFDNSVRVVASENVMFYGYNLWSASTHFAAVGGLDASSGTRLWEWREPEQSSRESGGLHLKSAGGIVYAIMSSGVYAFSGVDGRLLWHAPGGVGIARAVLSVDGPREQ